MEYSKIKILQRCNILDKEMIDGQLKDSKSLKIKSYCFYIISTLNLTRFIISTYYPKDDIYQLYIGSFFNYLDRQLANFFAIDAYTITIWTSLIFFNFKYLNNKREDLLLLWLRMSNQMPYDNDNKLYGISKNKNKEFWQRINKFNRISIKINKLFTILITSLFCVPLLINNYGVNYYLFYSIFLINYSLHLIFILFFLDLVNVLSLLHIELLYFFTKKFDFLFKKIKKLEDKDKLDNLDILNLDKRIYHFKYCLFYEIINIDKLFRYFVFFNFVAYFLVALITFFLSIDVDIRLSIIIFAILIVWFFAILYFPFKISGSVLSKAHKINRSLQNISFKKEIQIAQKIKINDIGNHLLHSNGFTCSNIFSLNSYNSVIAFSNMLCYILMLIRIFHINKT